MCGRYTLVFPAGEVAKHLEVRLEEDFGPSWNISPGIEVPAIIPDASEREPAASLELFHWGFSNPGTGLVVNARAETVSQRRMFATAWRENPCVVPASGFYEWDRSGTHRQKQPWYFSPATAPYFLLAGFWRHEGPRRSLVLLTEEAVEPVSRIHHRMPVFLDPANWRSWLAPEDARIRETLRVAPETVRAHPVSLAVNRVANNEPELINPVTPPSDPQLDLF